MKKYVIKNKKNFIITLVITVLSIGCGIGAGLYLGQEFITPQTDYSSFNEIELEDDNDALYNRYLSTNPNSYLSTFKSYELVNISLKKLSKEVSFRSTDIGSVVAAGVTQTIYGTSIKENDSYFNESISSSSLVKVAKRFYQVDDEVTIYNGGVISSTIASWDSTSLEEMTTEEFENTWGKTLDRSSIYIVSSKTVLDEGKVENDGTNYKVTLNLDPIKSVIRYVRQMTMMSDLSRSPDFTSVQITYTLDQNLRLLNCDIYESYEVWKFGKHMSNSHLTTTYYYQGSSIPDLNTNCQY